MLKENIKKRILVYADPTDDLLLPVYSEYLTDNVIENKDAFSCLFTKSYDAILIDFNFTPHEAINLLEEVKLIQNWICVFVIENEKNSFISDKHKSDVIILNKCISKTNSIVGCIRNDLNVYGAEADKSLVSKSILTILPEFNKCLIVDEYTKYCEKIANILNKYFHSYSVVYYDYIFTKETYIFSEKKYSSDVFEYIKAQILDKFYKLTGVDKKNDIISVDYDKLAKKITEESNTRIPVLSFIIPITFDNKIYGAFALYVDEKDNKDLGVMCRYLFDNVQVYYEIRNKSIHNSYNDLYNYNNLKSILNNAWNRERKDKFCMAILVISIDDYEEKNQLYGYDIGDSLFKELARHIDGIINVEKSLIHFSRGELVACMPEIELEGFDILADKILNSVRDHVFKDSGVPLMISVSIGSASNIMNEINKVDDLFILAKKSLMLAIECGKNQYCNAAKVFEHKRNIPDGQQTSRMDLDNENVEEHVRGGKILIVDDDDMVLAVLDRVLTIIYKYDVIKCNNVEEAIEIVKKENDRIDLVITDINMPGLNGIDFIKIIKNINPDIITLVITGYATTDNLIATLRAGAYNLIPKPFNNEELGLIVEKGFERRLLKRQLDSYHSNLEKILQERTIALNDSLGKLKVAYISTMELIVDILDKYESSTAQHSYRVSQLSVTLAKEYGIKDPDELQTIEYGALLHDIGKMAIPNSILAKPGTLTVNEKDVVITHSKIGYEIVNTIPILHDAAVMIYSHHERFDGEGYPRRILGKDICIGARLFAVVDTFDAMRSDRSYRKSLPLEVVIKEINNNSGSQFDPDIVKVFNNCYLQLDEILKLNIKN